MIQKQKATIGYEYEFYCDMKPRALSNSLKKHLGYTIVYFEDDKSNDAILAKKNGKFVLTIDKSGGIEMYELITPPLEYQVGKKFLQDMNAWLEDFGVTTKHSGLHINIGIPDMKIDPFKFILSFDEERIYKAFPHRRNNLYCNSIKSIFPKELHFPFLPEYKLNYSYPLTKYFGVNFEKISKNYLEYRYLGGENYHKRTKSILNLIEYFIEHLFSINGVKHLTQSDKYEFARLIEPAKVLKDKISSYERFIQSFPKVTISANLDTKPNAVKAIWSTIQKLLFDTILRNKFKGEYLINYNSDYSTLEFANASNPIVGIYLKNIIFYNCELSGVLSHCIIHECELKNAAAYFSKLNQCELTDSKIFNSTSTNCTYNNVYVSNPETDNYISGQFNEGVIAQAIAIKDEFFYDEKSSLIKVVNLSFK